MYSQGHLIFIGISPILILFGTAMCRKYKPPIDNVVQLCFLLSLFLEAAKILTVIEIIPVVEPVVENGVLVYRGTGAYAPYIEREHLPFELCSLQIVFMFLERIVFSPVWKKRLLAFGIAMAIHAVYHRLGQRRRAQLMKRWSAEMDLVEIKIEIYGPVRYMEAHEDEHFAILPLDIIQMLGEKYRLSEAELIRPYIRGLLDARNERRTAGE